ncbi:glycosyltransferase [Agrobacterium sp. AGB01]|uniref:glycosyltransferase family 2 protein n=1 Tax=Agrobacterium sp. AGB01 TaxID=2769302 RepID=UPI00177FF10B|nr:glycosyltransferase [Agrobacterium sp. AGB01]MBD9388226.1 glycosyltransferase [Agrobacterium sp. AGB01]
MDNPDTAVDIIILSWGRIPDTCAAIDSALSQKGIVPNVIVVDQGTPDDELSILKAHVAQNPSVTLVCNDKNRGVPGGRNQASSLGSAPYIVALDNDAEFASSDEVAKAVTYMEADATVAALAFRIVLFSDGEDDKSSWPYPLSMSKYSGQRFQTARFVGAGHMLRRSTFDAVKGYDDTLIFLHEEVDLAYRLINAGGTMVYEPSVRIRHKVSAENRVSWTGRRYYFHVRNTIYMASKFNFSPVSSLMNATLAITRGLRSGYIKGTLQGVFAGIGLIPRGLKQRWFDSRVRLSRDARKNIKATSPTRDMSLVQKIRYRLVPDTKAAQ